MLTRTKCGRKVLGVLLICAFSVACDRRDSAQEPESPAKRSKEKGEDDRGDQSVIERAEDFYQGRSYFERPVTRAGTVKGIPDVRAETCGQCHRAIYEEWKVSTHRRAWLDDAQFQAELAKSRGEDGPDKGDVSWLCVNCHTPVVEQLPTLVVGLENGQIDQPVRVKNPSFDARLQEEAITCATCHVEDGVIRGPYGSDLAPHPVEKDESLLEVDICVRCHQAEQFYERQNLGCFFTTGREWQQSPHGARGETCQSCHMPEVRRQAAEGDLPVRRTRRHWFGGSLIPKKPEYADELAPLEEVFGDGLSFDLKPMTPRWRRVRKEQPDMAEPDQEIAIDRRTPCPEGSCRDLALVVRNDGAGHYVPTGDPERHVDVHAVVKADGETVSKAWFRYGSRYEWWPETKLLADTRVPPEGSRVINVEVPRQGEAVVEVTATKYRMYPEAFEYHELEGEYVRGRTFFERTFSVRDGKPVE